MTTKKALLGWALTLVASAAMVYAVYHLAQTGTCSSTGYNGNFGPVPKCPGNIGFVIGAMLAGLFVFGAAFTITDRDEGYMVTVWIASIAVGGLLLALKHNASSGKHTAGIVVVGAAGVCALLALAGTIAYYGSKRRRERALTEAAIAAGKRGGVPATPGSLLAGESAQRPTRTSAPKPSQPLGTRAWTSSPASGSKLDEIARLDELRQRGVLTEAEFEQAKTKLLAEL